MELLDAIPPVVTGVENAIDKWENSRTTLERDKTKDSVLSIDLGSVSSTAEEPRLPCGSDLDDLSTKEDYRSGEEGVPATKVSPETAGAETLVRARKGGGGGSVDNGLETHTSLPSVGLNRLCRRAVVLLTRSPACPDLVECQTEPANQRTYDQMGPLLARAHMSFRDLHPESVGDTTSSNVRLEQKAK